MRKKPGDEALQVSIKFPRRGWDKRLADFNKFSNIEWRSCYSCLVLQLYDETTKSKLLNEKTNCWMHMQLLHKQLLDIKLKSGIIAYIKMIVEWNCWKNWIWKYKDIKWKENHWIQINNNWILLHIGRHNAAP